MRHGQFRRAVAGRSPSLTMRESAVKRIQSHDSMATARGWVNSYKQTWVNFRERQGSGQFTRVRCCAGHVGEPLSAGRDIIQKHGSITVLTKDSPRGHACGLDRASARPGRCRVEQGEVGSTSSTLGGGDLGLRSCNVKLASVVGVRQAPDRGGVCLFRSPGVILNAGCRGISRGLSTPVASHIIGPCQASR
jgi:hypothetical protein